MKYLYVVLLLSIFISVWMPKSPEYSLVATYKDPSLIKNPHKILQLGPFSNLEACKKIKKELSSFSEKNPENSFIYGPFHCINLVSGEYK